MCELEPAFKPQIIYTDECNYSLFFPPFLLSPFLLFFGSIFGRLARRHQISSQWRADDFSCDIFKLKVGCCRCRFTLLNWTIFSCSVMTTRTSNTVRERKLLFFCLFVFPLSVFSYNQSSHQASWLAMLLCYAKLCGFASPEVQ